MYQIQKCLKTKSKVIFETDSLEELKKQVALLDLREFTRPYFFTSVRCEDCFGKQYALTQTYVFDTGESVIVSPEKIAKLFKL